MWLVLPGPSEGLGEVPQDQVRLAYAAWWHELLRTLTAISLAALGAAIMVTGCSLVPAPTIGVKVHPRATPPRRYSPFPQGTNSFAINAPNVFGLLSGGSARVSCSQGGHTVEVSGTVQGASVAIKLTNLRPRQNLSDPPVVGGFSDLVTMRVTEVGSPHPLRYLAGSQDGTYQGVGTLTVDKTGRGGTVSISFGPPIGQNPTSQSSGNETTTGLNDGGISGTWRCP